MTAQHAQIFVDNGGRERERERERGVCKHMQLHTDMSIYIGIHMCAHIDRHVCVRMYLHDMYRCLHRNPWDLHFYCGHQPRQASVDLVKVDGPLSWGVLFAISPREVLLKWIDRGKRREVKQLLIRGPHGSSSRPMEPSPENLPESKTVGNGIHRDTTERASQKLVCSYKGGFPCITEVGRNPLIPQPCLRECRFRFVLDLIEFTIGGASMLKIAWRVACDCDL